MPTSKRFIELTLLSDGIQLQLGSNYMEFVYYNVEKIYLTTHKKSTIGIYLYIISSVILVLFKFSYVVFFLILFFLLVGHFFLRNKYKLKWNKLIEFQLVIVLKNGDSFVNPIASNKKSDTIELINKIKKNLNPTLNQ